MVGRIERVPLREVWKHEALDFTRWLEENIDELGEELGLELNLIERESSVGDFNIDLLAEDADGKPVVIENQLERSNHDHLGKVITYLSNIEASSAIWIVKEPRPEHINAINWLNESTSAAFYLVKIEAVKIGESEPAPLLSKIVGPSEEIRRVGVQKRGLSDKGKLHKEFWTGLIEKANGKVKWLAAKSPTHSPVQGISLGITGVILHIVLRKDWVKVELAIDTPDRDMNLRIFDTLFNKKETIEDTFGDSLAWQRKENVRVCRINAVYSVGEYLKDRTMWLEVFEKLIAGIIRLEKAILPHIKEIKGSL